MYLQLLLKNMVTQRSLFFKSMPYKTFFCSKFLRFISHTFGIICVISKLFLLLTDKIIKSINKKRKFTKNNVGHLPLVFRDSADSTLVGLFHKSKICINVSTFSTQNPKTVLICYLFSLNSISLYIKF